MFGAIITLAGLTLVLPTFTTSQPGPEFNDTQLTFAALASIAVYGLFISALTVRHRPDYLPASSDGKRDESLESDEDTYDGKPPTSREALTSLVLLLLARSPRSERRNATKSKPA